MTESLQQDDVVSAAGGNMPSLEDIAAALADVRSELARANEVATKRERIIDWLHEENQRLRSGEHQLMLRPVVVDLYRLRDELLRQAPALPDSLGKAQVAALLESFADSVEQTLERCGVYPIRLSPGDDFDPRQHQAVGTTQAGGVAQDGRIAQVLADGYRDSVDGRVLVAARVLVARWTPPAGPPHADEQPVPDQADDEGEPANQTTASQATASQATASQTTASQATDPAPPVPDQRRGDPHVGGDSHVD